MRAALRREGSGSESIERRPAADGTGTVDVDTDVDIDIGIVDAIDIFG